MLGVDFKEHFYKKYFLYLLKQTFIDLKFKYIYVTITVTINFKTFKVFMFHLKF